MDLKAKMPTDYRIEPSTSETLTSLFSSQTDVLRHLLDSYKTDEHTSDQTKQGPDHELIL